MKKQNFIGPWIKQFLLEYLMSRRNLSRNTQCSYRDTFRLCLPFISKKSKKQIDQLTIEDMSAKLVVIFLQHIELTRNCGLATRNQRLAALHAFAKFVSLSSPEHVEWCRQIRLIPFKKAKQPLITYLEKFEIEALINAPDRSTAQGRRDYVLLLFLYNTGARADEAAQTVISDLDLPFRSKGNFPTVLIKGKGGKLRRCPLWEQTVRELNLIVTGRKPADHVFLNRCGHPITRFGIYALVRRYVVGLFPTIPSLEKKRVSPHTIRHTTATQLLHSGVDINTIRAWLGHVSLNTTNLYADVDLEMKARALASCELTSRKPRKHWRDDKKLMNFLDSISLLQDNSVNLQN